MIFSDKRFNIPTPHDHPVSLDPCLAICMICLPMTEAFIGPCGGG